MQTDVFPRGPHKNIGHIDYSYHDEDLPEGIFCRIYYPATKDRVITTKDGSESASKYWLPKWDYGRGYLKYLNLHGVVTDVLGTIFSSFAMVTSDPELVLAKGDAFPVVLFSHGIVSMRTTYSMMCTDLASHGWIVVAMEHRDGSACFTTDLHGNQVPYKDFGLDLQKRSSQLDYRAKELLFCLGNALPALNSGSVKDSPALAQFSSRLNLDHVMLLGHSFGGSTCIKALYRLNEEIDVSNGKANRPLDSGIIITVILDPWMLPLGDSSPRPNNKRGIGLMNDPPILIINSEKFFTENDKEMLLSHIQAHLGVDPRLQTVSDALADDVDNQFYGQDQVPKAMVTTLPGTRHIYISDIFYMCPRLFAKMALSGKMAGSAYDEDPLKAILDHVDMIFYFLSLHNIKCIWKFPVSEEVSKLSDEDVYLNYDIQNTKNAERPSNVTIDALFFK